ncbi:MAG TPA: DUF2804 domain-containing protein [Candidatus Brocadiia bacterium]|nr:DUF2804 domain-containing protein [Candidatus Brocadiia bacterium]
MAKYEERELTSPVSLCAPDGGLNPDAVGWSRQPLHDCNLNGAWLRKKRWNYWCVTSERFLFSATLADVDYIGLSFAYFLDFDTGELVEGGIVTPLGMNCRLPDKVEADIAIRRRRWNFTVKYQPGGMRFAFNCPSIKGKAVSADLSFERPVSLESLNVVIPWSARQFQFTSKQNSIPATGCVRIGGKTYNADPSCSFACLDFGRGIWPYFTTWNWASASGYQGKDLIGLNLGAKWTDGTGYNENGMWLNGRLHKLSEDLDFAYDRSDFKKPWRIRTQATDRLDLVFTPFFEHLSGMNLLVLASEGHQCFGYFSGKLRFDDAAVNVDRLLGWAEEHRARW